MMQPNKRKLPWTSFGKQARDILTSPIPTKKQHVDMAVPSEENISTLEAITGCTRETAIRYLKAKNNNVDQAVNACLDGEDVKEEKWDEAVWMADRNDANLRPLGASAAPTRGPSPAGSFRQPNSQEQEERDMNAAMMASYSQEHKQEQGVIRADGSVAPIYGPEYNPNQWALVKATPITREVLPDVPVMERNAGALPRFLKPSTDYLPSFLTICHAIPAARNIFLVPGSEILTYGCEPDWWKGHEIIAPRIVHTSDGTAAEPLSSKYDDFLSELQRLMAFLDSSHRAYATTVNIEKPLVIQQTKTTSERRNITTFLIELAIATKIHTHRDDVMELFSTIPGSEDEDVTTPILEVIQLDVEGESQSLYGILDNVLWDIEAGEEPEDRYLAKLPGVLTLRLQQRSSDVSSLSVRAPGVLYMDKYLKANLGHVKPLRQKISKGKQHVHKLDEVSNKLKTWEHNNKQIDAHALLTDAQAQFAVERPANGYSPGFKDIAGELDSVITRISNKLTELDSELKAAKLALAELSEPPADLRNCGYALAGVSTKLNTTYVLRPQAEDEEPLLDRDADDETPEGMQWWRLEYVHNGMTASMHRTKAASYDVAAAIELEHNTALLVYASQAAMQSPLLPLTPQLQDFVAKDNDLYAHELSTAPPPPAYTFRESYDVPVTSVERKTSMDSLTAHHDSPDMGAFEDDPTQHAAFNLGYGADVEYDDAPVAVIPPPDDSADTMETSQAGEPPEYMEGIKKDES